MGKAKIIHVKVKPNARTSSFEPSGRDGLWLARLKSPPVDGKANAELVSLVAKHFSCPRAAVSIRSGESRRMKRVRIDIA